MEKKKLNEVQMKGMIPLRPRSLKLWNNSAKELSFYETLLKGFIIWNLSSIQISCTFEYFHFFLVLTAGFISVQDGSLSVFENYGTTKGHDALFS